MGLIPTCAYAIMEANTIIEADVSQMFSFMLNINGLSKRLDNSSYCNLTQTLHKCNICPYKEKVLVEIIRNIIFTKTLI